jgi:3-hydroxyisobutyrate dehydrogenase
MRIGFIGLGNMGGPMALNMIKAGHPLTVYDVRREAAEPHLAAGARWAESPGAVAAECELVVTSLPGPKEIEEVALGEGGIIGGIARGAIYADLSTNSPALVRRLHAAFKEKGIEVLDTPVSGGIPGARNATLAVMVGAIARPSKRSSLHSMLSAIKFHISARAGRVRSQSWFIT